ncbi:ATP-binding protein [Cellvibrio japonicus]|uniref:ATP synthase, Delta/Epsilon chain, long alpha-helix domain n=1 Tax=Cellvibrio japonicus (strain Ueda107) TaxID=498211 RepID=B3PE77_CELJU|nr:ATP-binding protein [Cellvibrio japonicus]ACE84923.1 ATP synthase, Delta/Epsilon chain, long alpha-helix domain [Cellvibrio japonicus Ueda107]QEI12119.1 hypothetical protein FY117_07725 [Cellvibrio japonicus]QEI15693.1 hypothetical protein FY116_07730 [Cellvibrio japonicus]QEI19271.1 hypothetical protein FY115_07725 [Cellvibrio japonicus]
MNQATLWVDNDTYILRQMDVFNWGGFDGLHQAAIDPAGTAIIGPTGSGKTTLVDALMTLLCANPRYNLASTGGHESDRDLVSYVRGVSGPGDGGPDQSHIARPGKTVTAIAATFHNGEKQVRLGCLLWFEGTSSVASDLKKLWLFSSSPEQTLEHWLTVHHEGGMRALRAMEKTDTGIWTFPSKKSYLARLRDYFDVGENAFTLLNRAAGLKQLNSIDEIFRELVLDDHAAFDRAAEVVKGFDDLKDIHEELEIARRQQRSLIPVAETWEAYQKSERQLAEQETLKKILPVWFAEQAHGLWRQEAERLQAEQQSAQQAEAALADERQRQKKTVDGLRQAYLQVGGASVEDMQERIAEWRNTRARRESHAAQYRQLVNTLKLPDTLSAQALKANQQEAQSRSEQLKSDLASAQENAYAKGVAEKAVKDALAQWQQEYQEAKNSPNSNLEPKFQQFRTALAHQLGLTEDALPFVAELVQVKEHERAWRGAIERAIGSDRLRILVPPEQIEDALRWVNQRHNHLHVRLLEVKQPEKQPRFFEDGYTRKLDYKDHPYREAVKDLLAGQDRHCVNSPEQLRTTPHAMTVEGTMSGKTRFFDKQDQKRIDEDWLTGFDNRDRLAVLQERIAAARTELRDASAQVEAARARESELSAQQRLLQALLALNFDDINVPEADQKLQDLEARLVQLNAPDSDIAAAKKNMQLAEEQLEVLDQQYREAGVAVSTIERDFKQASTQQQKAWQRAQVGLTDADRILATAHFPAISAPQLGDLYDLEKQQQDSLQQSIDTLKEKLRKLESELVKKMSDAKKEDRGALSEVGRELEDVPQYLARLQVLTEEALPEKLRQFLEYLNKSSDESVTQLLSYVDNEVAIIEERIEDLNNTLRRVDFQPGRYLRLVSGRVVHESLRSLQKAQRHLASARFNDDAGESHYKALQYLVALLRDACERNRTQGAKALLDPRFRLEFKVSVIDRESGSVIETRSGSQGGSGGEKEIIASYVLTASLSYALCPDGSSRPLFGTIVLDEAFSRSSHAVAGRIIAALREFGLHALFITPNKEMRLLRSHTRSAIVVHRRGLSSTLTSLSWEALDEFHQQRSKNQHEVAR